MGKLAVRMAILELPTACLDGEQCHVTSLPDRSVMGLDGRGSVGTKEGTERT